MKGLRLLLMLTVLTTFMVGTAVAADYYVYRNNTGQTLVLDYVPGLGWTRTDGPYDAPDGAKRACGIGSTTGWCVGKVPIPASQNLSTDQGEAQRDPHTCIRGEWRIRQEEMAKLEKRFKDIEDDADKDFIAPTDPQRQSPRTLRANVQ